MGTVPPPTATAVPAAGNHVVYAAGPLASVLHTYKRAGRRLTCCIYGVHARVYRRRENYTPPESSTIKLIYPKRGFGRTEGGGRSRRRLGGGAPRREVGGPGEGEKPLKSLLAEGAARLIGFRLPSVVRQISRPPPPRFTLRLHPPCTATPPYLARHRRRNGSFIFFSLSAGRRRNSLETRFYFFTVSPHP